jgi:hypothetical protein
MLTIVAFPNGFSVMAKMIVEMEPTNNPKIVRLARRREISNAEIEDVCPSKCLTFFNFLCTCTGHSVNI